MTRCEVITDIDSISVFNDAHQGHHNGQATTALSETVALDRAVEAVMNITDTGNTLGKNILKNKDYM